MNFDEYRDHMAAAHQVFTEQVNAMLAAYGRTQTVFTETLRDIERHINDITESQEELKRLIMEQGQELRALRARLNGDT
jgi:hypothetical protein